VLLPVWVAMETTDLPLEQGRLGEQPLCVCWCLSTFCDWDENAANYSCAYLRQGKSRCHESQDQWFSASDKSFFFCCTIAEYEIEREMKLESSGKKHPSRTCLESRR